MPPTYDQALFDEAVEKLALSGPIYRAEQLSENTIRLYMPGQITVYTRPGPAKPKKRTPKKPQV